MSKAIAKLTAAMTYAMTIRPKVAGFPVLAEVLRMAGVKINRWYLPSCQSIYLTGAGPIVSQAQPLFSGQAEIPAFNKDALILALRRDQAGNSSFAEFLQASWEAGVVSYEVQLEKRVVAYYGVAGEVYLEAYPAVKVDSWT